jgi:hypothetical protein
MTDVIPNRCEEANALKISPFGAGEISKGSFSVYNFLKISLLEDQKLFKFR